MYLGLVKRIVEIQIHNSPCSHMPSLVRPKNSKVFLQLTTLPISPGQSQRGDLLHLVQANFDQAGRVGK